MSNYRPVATRQRSNRPAQQGGNTLATLINQMRPELQRALPKHMDPDRMARIALTVLRQTPKLNECDPQSFLGALMTCAQVGLEPGPLGEAYLVPYGRTVTFVPGYRGLVKLAWQSGQLNTIAAHVVYEHDEFDYSYGLEPTLTHKPALSNRGEVIAVYAVATFKHGGNAFEIMSVDDVKAIQRRSRADNDGPWKTDWEQMARKTVLKRLSKWLPLSSEFASAIERDGTVRTEVGVPLEDVKPDWIDGEVEPDPSRVTIDEIQGDTAPPEETTEPPITDEQLKTLRGLLGNWKHTTAAARLEYLRSQFGDELQSEKHLASDVAQQFIEWLQQEQASETPAAEEPASE